MQRLEPSKSFETMYRGAVIYHVVRTSGSASFILMTGGVQEILLLK